MPIENEAHLHELVRRVYANLPAATRAMSRIEARRQAWIDEATEEHRQTARHRAMLAELARRLLLDVPNVEFSTERDSGEPWFYRSINVNGGTSAWWIERANEMGIPYFGRPRMELEHVIKLVEVAKDKGFDLASHTGVECALFGRRNSRSAEWMPEYEIVSEFDAEKVVEKRYPSALEFFPQLRLEADNPERTRDDEEWWEVAVLLVLFNYPSFDGTRIGRAEPLHWKNATENGGDGWARSLCAPMVEGIRTEHDRLIERAVENLRLAEEVAAVGSAPLHAGSEPEAATGVDVRGNSPAALILQVLAEEGAHSRMDAVKRATVVEKALGTKLKRGGLDLCAELCAAGYLGAVRGATGGVWLLDKGREAVRANKAASKPAP